MSHNLVSMKLSKKQAKGEGAVGIDHPRFPYGLQISFDHDSLDKLGFDDLPAVGAEMVIVGVGKVASVSESRNQDNFNRNVSIQLEKVSVEPTTDPTALDAVTKAVKDI